MIDSIRPNAFLYFPLIVFTACSPAPAGTAAAAPVVADEIQSPATDVAAASSTRDIPGGRVDKACIHEVPDGASVATDGTVRLNDKVVAKFPPCSASVTPHKPPGAPVDKSRIEDDSAAAFPRGACPAPHGTCAGFFDGLQDAWEVPQPPASNGALIYLFNALASADGVTTVNSVLQYGSNGVFGGNFWTVSSWYVTKHNVFYTKPVTVAPGDSIGGGLFGASCTSKGACSWMLEAAGGAVFPNLTVAGTTPLVTAYRAVLEAFHVTSCNQLPASGSTLFDLTIVTEPDQDNRGQDEIEDVLTWVPAVTPGVSPSCNYGVTDDEFSATLTY